jgi:hypothetical protein
MKDEEEIVIEPHYDAFPETSDFKHPLPLSLQYVWSHGTQQERASQANFVNPRAQNSSFKLLNIDNDVRELRH